MNARSVGLLLALVGVAVVAHPLYLFPHHGQNEYHLSVAGTVDEQPPPDETVAFEDLPPVAQERFEAELAGDSESVWTGEHEDAYEALSDHEYVQYRGEYYDYRFRGSDDFGGGLNGLVRTVLSTLGVIALVVGGFVARTGEYRPLTPLRALWIPVGVFAALVATEIYDARVGGAFAPPSYVHLPAIIAALVGASVVGSVVKRRWGSLRVPVPVLAVAVVAAAVELTVSPTNGSLAAGALVFLVVTWPWFGLGYGLTAPSESK